MEEGEGEVGTEPEEKGNWCNDPVELALCQKNCLYACVCFLCICFIKCCCYPGKYKPGDEVEIPESLEYDHYGEEALNYHP